MPPIYIHMGGFLYGADSCKTIKTSTDDEGAAGSLPGNRLMLLLLALLLYKMGLGENQVNLGILIIYIVSCFLGGFYLGKK